MVNGMENRETSELGGEGAAVCSKRLISWVFTPVLKEWGHGQGGMPFFL
jgi:hypothetical protein